MKTNKEVVDELVKMIFENISEHLSGNSIMLAPALNIVKMKVKNMDEADADFIIDAVHQISHRIETETGRLSPYHGIDNVQQDTAIVKI